MAINFYDYYMNEQRRKKQAEIEAVVRKIYEDTAKMKKPFRVSVNGSEERIIMAKDDMELRKIILKEKGITQKLINGEVNPEDLKFIGYTYDPFKIDVIDKLGYIENVEFEVLKEEE